MGIKNMPEFDDIDISVSNESNQPKKSTTDIKMILSSLGINQIEQLKQLYTMLGFPQEVIAELDSFNSVDELADAVEASMGSGDNEMASMISGIMTQINQLRGFTAPNTTQHQAPTQQQSSTAPNIEVSLELDDEDNAVLEDIIEDFLNGSTNSEEFVGEVCEFLADLNCCFSGDLQHIEDSLDNMHKSGTTTAEIKKFIFSNIDDLQEIDPDEDYEDDESEEPEFGDSDGEEDTKIKVFNDNVQQLVEREDKLFSVKYLPFGAKEFKNHFELDEDQLEENKIPIDKFSEILPEKWKESFEFVTLATPYIDDTNKFIIGYLVPNFNNNSAIPVNFLIYKDSTGYHIYVPKADNLIGDNNELLTLEDIYTPEAIEYCKKSLENASSQQDDLGAFMQQFGAMLGGSTAQPAPQQNQSTDQAAIRGKLNKSLYRTLLQTLGGYDDKRTFERSSKLMIREDANPLMTLHMLGELTPTLETKQYGNGYVYVGTVTLNDSEDVKYFLSDFELKPDNGKLDFYVKMENSEIKRNDLPKYKEYIRNHFDFNDDSFQNHLEVQALDNIVYIEF